MIFIILFSLGISLYYPPNNADDLEIISNVNKNINPFKYFVGGWALDDNYYRPIHSIIQWFLVSKFSIWTFPSQFLSLIIHSINVFLIYKITRLSKVNIIWSLLFAILFSTSIYTFSGATWVSDRTSALTGLSLLLTIKHLIKNKFDHFNIIYIIFLSVLALLSRETGVIVPILSTIYFLFEKTKSIKKPLLIVFNLITLIIYFILRANFLSNSNLLGIEDGYFFNIFYYESIADLSPILRYFAYLDNVLKNIISIFFPLFNMDGGINFDLNFFLRLPLMILIPTLTIYSYGKAYRLSKDQIFFLCIVIINSLIHYSIFRFRCNYVSEIGLILFLSFSNKFNEFYFNELTKFSKVFLSFFMTCVVFSSIVRSASFSKERILYKIDESAPGFKNVDKEIYNEVYDLYPNIKL